VLWEEVTRARANVIMEETPDAQAEKMAQEGDVLLVTIHSEVDEPAQGVSILEGELVAMGQASDVAEGKFLSL
jgi:hypothetical protein